MDVEVMVQMRSKTGKGAARCLRRENSIPAVLYGPKTEPVSLSVSAKRLEKLLRDMGDESKLLRLTIDGGETSETKQVLIREVQIHPVRRRFLHVDFFEVPMDQPIVVDVPVELVGESIGVKKGGTLNLIRRMLSVRCLPGEIPDRVQVAVGDLDVGSTIQVGDIVGKVPVDLVDDRSFAIVTVASPEGKSKEGEGAEG